MMLRPWLFHVGSTSFSSFSVSSIASACHLYRLSRARARVRRHVSGHVRRRRQVRRHVCLRGHHLGMPELECVECVDMCVDKWCGRVGTCEAIISAWRSSSVWLSRQSRMVVCMWYSCLLVIDSSHSFSSRLAALSCPFSSTAVRRGLSTASVSQGISTCRLDMCSDTSLHVCLDTCLDRCIDVTSELRR